MSKEEILNKTHWDLVCEHGVSAIHTQTFPSAYKEQAMLAMDFFAKQEAIAMLKDLRERRIHTDIISQEIRWVIRDINDNLLGYYGEATDEQLYNLYLQSKQSKT